MEVYDRQAIQELIPHRGRMLLLDEVFLGIRTLFGTLEITDVLCEGHVVSGASGKIFRGSDIYDMAGQLLGVWAALRGIETQKEISVVRRYGEAVFKGMVVPGDVLKIGIAVADIKIVRMRSFGWKIIGKDFTATVKDKIKSEIFFVELFVA